MQGKDASEGCTRCVIDLLLLAVGKDLLKWSVDQNRSLKSSLFQKFKD